MKFHRLVISTSKIVLGILYVIQTAKIQCEFKFLVGVTIWSLLLSILIIYTVMSPLLLTASGLTPWQLFKQICRFVSPSSPQCQLYQQPFIPTQPFSPQLQQQPSTSPPVANAGPNQAVTQSSLVTLDGTLATAAAKDLE